MPRCTPQISIHSRCLAMLSVLMILLGSSRASAQDALDILDASRDALREVSGFSAQFRMKGEGGSMFASTMPSMSGQLFFGTHDEYGRVIHCIGESRDQQSTPSQAIDLLIASDRYLWTDMKAQTINERPNRKSSTRGLLSAIPLVLIQSIVSDAPYANDADNAETIDLLAQETISGELCDVIHIKRTKPGSGSKRSGNDSYTDAKWYISTKDKLPRKVEHITDAGLVKITLLFELSNLKVITPTQSQLDITRPDGFAFKSTMPKPRPVGTPDDSPSAQPDPSTFPDPSMRGRPINTPQTPAKPIVKQAPPYSFTPIGSSEINNTTQINRITVLSFWGSWCAPCKEANESISGLVNELASESPDQPVDVFALAIRQADPDQARSDFELAGYAHALVLDADDQAKNFEIRVYPTIVVLNGSGEIVFHKGITKERTSKQLVDEAKDAIEKLFAIENGD
jgi:thiol-disulfide isomerase/thioredoxin